MVRGKRRRLVLCALAGSLALLVATPVAAQATATIKGTVTEAAGAKLPIAEVEVEVLSSTTPAVEGFATTGAGGKYEAIVPSGGSYKVRFSPGFGSPFAGQYFQAKSTLASADSVAVSEGAVAENVDAALGEGSTISGTVDDEGVPLAGAEVAVFSLPSSGLFFVGSAVTEAGGAYTVKGVPPGSYEVSFNPAFGVNLIPQVFDGKASFAEADPVEVKAEGEAIAGIGANLQVGAQISGTVVDASTHQPLAGVAVIANNSRGLEFFGGFAETDSNGRYTVSGLASGTYDLEYLAEGTRQYLPLTDAVSVTRPNTMAGIDVSLIRAAPVNTSAPVISGTPTVGGQALGCSPGSWTGKAALKFTFQWTRDGSAIANATASSYVVQVADLGHVVACQVTAANAVGHATASSNAVAVPAVVATPLPLIVHPGPGSIQKVAASGVASVSAGIARLRLSCRTTARCVGTLKLVRQVAVRTRRNHHTLVRRKTIVLAQGAYSLKGGRTALVSLKLTAAGRSRLAHARRHRLTTTLVLSLKGAATTRQSVLLIKATTRRRR